MALYSFPGQSGWKQTNINDTDGTLYATKNIDLSSGKLALAPRMTAFTTSASLATLGLLREGAWAGITGRNFVFITSSAIFYGNSTLGTITLENTSGVPVPTTKNGNVQTFGANLPYVAAGSVVKKFSGGAWSASLVSIGSAYPHPMCISPGNKLLIGDTYKVHSITTADAVTSFTSTFPIDYSIVDLIADTVRVYVFACHEYGGNEAKMFIWDGTSSAFTSSHNIGSMSIQSACISNGNVYVLTVDGDLKLFNGLGFDTVASLPYAARNKETRIGLYLVATTGNMDGNIAPSRNGVYINFTTPIEDYSYASVTSKYTGQNMLMGVWEYIPGVGLYHKYSPNYTTDSTAPTDFGNVDSTNTKSTGIMVLPGASDSNGNAPNVKLNAYGSDVIIGGQIRVDSSTQHYVLCSATTGRNIGYFILPKVFPVAVDEVFQKIVIKYNNCFDSSTKIKVKYKVKTKQYLPVTLNQGTWTADNTFTTTDTRCGSIAAGDEVCITSGPGAGKSTQVTSSTLNTGTYTIVVEDTVRPSSSYPVTGTVVDNFALLDTLTGSTSNDGVWEIPIPDKNIGGFIQVKVEIDSSERVVIESVDIVTKTNKSY